MDHLYGNLKLLQALKDLVDVEDADVLITLEACKSTCIKKILQHPLIQYVLNFSETENVEYFQNISSLLGGSDQQVDIADFDPNVFDSIGSGISALFKAPLPTLPLPQLPPQNHLKSESNLIYSIRKK